MPSAKLTLTALTGIKLVEPGDDLCAIAVAAFSANRIVPEPGDVLVVAQKIVSKAEGRYVDVTVVEPSARAVALAVEVDKDPRFVEVVLSESKRVVRHRRGLLIVEHRLGFVMANAGIDHSNLGAQGSGERVLLLPEDPDASAKKIHRVLEQAFGVRLAVIVSDTFGRPWREGLVNVAVGVSGIAPLIDYRGQKDSHGNALKVTVIAIADELASAAELVMKKSSGIPVVVIRGGDEAGNDQLSHAEAGEGRALLREDLWSDEGLRVLLRQVQAGALQGHRL